jgi:hypothetical protein
VLRDAAQTQAHVAVRNAIARGLLAPAGDCSNCGRKQGRHPDTLLSKGLPFVEYHHDDYARPLDVRALCRSCHGRWHRAPAA